jgi:hypothetical protein
MLAAAGSGMHSRTREEARPGQDLGAEGLRGGVVAAEEVEPAAGVAVGDAGQEVEVVVDDRPGDGLAGEVDQAGAGGAEEEEHAGARVQRVVATPA